MPSKTKAGTGLEKADKPGTLSVIASKVDAEARELAKKLDKAGYIYAFFAGVDGLSISCTTLQLLFSAYFTNNDSVSASDALHDWLKSPAGFLIAATESIAIIAFSMIANHNDSKNSKDSLKRFLALMWPYFRDILKATKNAYKGVRSLVQMANQLGGVNVNVLILPLGVALGGLAALNRVLYRRLKNKRKKMQDCNELLLAEIEQRCCLVRASADPENMSAQTRKELLNNQPSYILFDSKIYYIDSNGRLILLTSSNMGQLESIFPVENNKKTGLTQDNLEQIKSLTGHIPAKVVWTEEQRQAFRVQIIQEDVSTRVQGYFSAALGGAIDSLYLYLGLLGLSALAGPAFIPMAVFCIIQSICCIVSRSYDEYTAQRDFRVKKAEIDLALYINEREPAIQAWIAELQDLSIKLSRDNGEDASESTRAGWHVAFERVGSNLNNEIKVFTAKRNHLQSLQTLSNTEALLVGIKNGLSAYSAYSSAIFFVATVLILASTPFPPALLITSVSIGIALLLGFMTHALVQAYRHRAEMKAKTDSPDLKLFNMMMALKDPELVHGVRVDSVESIMGDGLVVDSSPQYFFQDWFEVIRMAFSGPGKGSKLLDFTLNDFQTRDRETGHYRDPLFMQILAIFPAILCTIVLPLTALSRSFSKRADKKKTLPPESAADHDLSVALQASNGENFDSDDLDDAFVIPGGQPAFVSDKTLPRSSSLPSLANQHHSFFSPGRTTVPDALPLRRAATPQLS